MATKLHEILAVEGTKEGYFKNTIPEMINLFKNKANHFMGFERTLKLNGEETVEKLNKEAAGREYQAITSTIASELKYLEQQVGDYFDVMLQRDEANQRAVSDIVVDGKVLAKNVPATTLLALENKLKQLRQVYEQIPTLQPGVVWNHDPSQGEGVFIDSHPEVRAKTEKGFDFKVLVNATDKFPAQVEKWEVTSDVGYFTKIRWCSMISVADKSALLSRFDSLAMGIKQARQRANEVEIKHEQIGNKLLQFIHNK